MDELPATVIVCARLDEVAEPYRPDSTVSECDDCGAEVWLSAVMESAALMADLVCMECLRARGGNPTVLVPEVPGA